MHILIRNNYTQDSLLECLQSPNYHLLILQKTKVYLCCRVKKVVGEEIRILWHKPEVRVVAREAAESMGLSYTQKVQEKVWILNLETPIPLSCSTAKHISNLQLHNYFFPQRKITTPKAKVDRCQQVWAWSQPHHL